MMELSDGRKSFPIGLAVLIQYRSVTATQPATQPPSHVAVAITLNAKASSIKNKLETKASPHEGQCIPAGYCHAYMLLYMSGVNYNVNSKYTKYFAQLCGRISTFRNISTTN